MTFNQQLLIEFESTATRKIFRKGELLTKEGEVESSIFFIVKGAVKVVYRMHREEQIIRLGYDGSIVNSLSSFLTNQPSQLSIEALKRTEVQVLKKDDFRRCIHRDDEIFSSYTAFLEEFTAAQMDRELDLLIDSPSERLKRVLKRSPYLFQHIPLKYIASYLRMTPETLSRIRNS